MNVWISNIHQHVYSTEETRLSRNSELFASEFLANIEQTVHYVLIMHGELWRMLKHHKIIHKITLRIKIIFYLNMLIKWFVYTNKYEDKINDMYNLHRVASFYKFIGCK